MIIDNVGNSMIKFRLKQKEYSRIDDLVLMDKSIKNVVNKLDDKNVFNYGLSVSIPDDVISINYGTSNKCSINIPVDLNEFQYDIEDYLIDNRPRLRYMTTRSRNIIRYILKDKVSEDKLCEMILYIIDRIGYVVICPELK